MQETTFPVEILIRDDASTDGTTDIVRSYEKKYPDLIKGFYEVENQYAKGVRASFILVKASRGQYIAGCEGDDYWCVADKLEKQVSLLRKHPECHMCVAKTRMVFDGTEKEDIVIEASPKKFLTFDDFINGCYAHTSSYVTRGLGKIHQQWKSRIRLTDTAVRYIYSDLGPVALLPEIVSVYRITGDGIWTSLSTLQKLDQEIEIHESFHRHFKKEYRELFSIKLLKQYKTGTVLNLKQKNLNGFIRYSAGFLKHCFLNPLALCKLAGRTVQRFSGCSA